MSYLMRGIKAFAIVCILMLIVTASAVATEWNAYNEFSKTTSNNLPWQYGYRNTAASTDLTLYSTLGFFYSGYEFWSNGNGNINEAILGISATNADLGQHPGPGSAKSVLRWVSPIDGSVAAYGKWYCTAGYTPTTDVHIVVNGNSVWDALVLYNSTPTQEHTAVATVAVGDTIDFVLGNNGEYSSDMTQLIATVSTVSSIGTISGTVVSTMPSNPAVADASVNVTDSNGASVGTAHTASDGSYSITVAPGDYTVAVSKLGYGTGSASKSVTAGETTPADFTIDTAVIEGYVYGAETSKPVISGATIMVDSSLYTTSDSNGYYSLHVAPGDITLTCKIPGRNNASETINVTTGTTVSNDFTLEESTVFDCYTDFSTTNNPNNSWQYGFKMSVTASDIILDLPPVQTYNEFQYWTYNGVNTGGFVGLDVVNGNSGGYGIGMHPADCGRKAAVRWTSPINGWANIRAAWDYYMSATTDVHVVLNGTELWSSNIDSATTPNAVCLTNKELQVGDVIDFVLGDGGNGFGSDCTQCSFCISKIQSMGTISGTVTSTLAGNPPVAGASVMVGEYSTTTAADGTYSISVPQGVYTVTASKAGHISNSVNNVRAESDTITPHVDITLDTALLNGYVKADLTYSPGIEGAVITIGDGTDYIISAWDGSYSVNLIPGSYNIQAQAGGYVASDIENITFKSGETITKNYNLTLSESSDVTDDFNLEANPNGIYKYGYLASDVFTAYSAPSWEYYYIKWWGDQSWAKGAIGKNLYYAPTSIGDDVYVNPGQLVMFPYHYPSVIRWTAPTNGLVEVSFSWSDISASATAETQTFIKHNGVDIATGEVNGANGISISSFESLLVSVTTGDTIDFVQKAGATSGNASDVTGVSGTISWQPAYCVGTIHGQVTNASNGSVIEGVTITTNSTPALSTTTDADGNYTLTVLPDTYTLTTDKYLYLAQTSDPITVNAGDVKTQNFVLEYDQSLYVQVTGKVTSIADGAPISGVTVTADTGETTSTDASGIYTLNLVAGTHTINAAKAGFTAVSISVTAPAADADMSMMPDAVMVSTITEAKAHMNEHVCINDPKVITIPNANLNDGSFYIEEPDRNCGLKVAGYSNMPALKDGQRVVLSGIMKTDEIGNTYMQLVSVVSQTDGDPLGALGMTNKTAVASITQNLLVKVWGKVTYVAGDKSYFYVNDGSNVDDGSGNLGIRVDLSNQAISRVAAIFTDESVSVTGVMEQIQGSGSSIKAIHPRSSLDINNAVVNNVTVTPSDSNWILQVASGTGSIAFASAPDMLYGSGGVLISESSDGTGVINLRTINSAGLKIADITELSISNYMTNINATGAKGIGVRMSVNLDDIPDNSDYGGDVDDIITCDPYYNSYTYALCQQNSWVTFDALNAGYWYSAQQLDGSSDAGPWKTLKDYLSLYPDAKIADYPTGGLRFFIGGCTPHWDNVTGFIDNIRVGTKDGITVYNFEQ